MSTYIAITGCGRSGTKYASLLLTNMGFDIRHEQYGRDGISSWCLAGACVSTPWGPGLLDLKKRDFVMAHQVRHPLAAISSLLTFSQRSWTFAADQCPQCHDSRKLVRAMKYWYHWNVMSERIAAFTYRVEDPFPGISRLLALAQRHLDVHAVNRAIQSTAPTTNSRKHRTVDWTELAERDPEYCRSIRELAARYGYRDCA